LPNWLRCFSGSWAAILRAPTPSRSWLAASEHRCWKDVANICKICKKLW
jgi:hypothetical protein